MSERRYTNDPKFLAIIGTCITIMLGWLWNEVSTKAETEEVRQAMANRWTLDQQREYRENIDKQLATMARDINRLQDEQEQLWRTITLSCKVTPERGRVRLSERGEAR